MAKQNSGGRFLKKNVKKRQAQSQSAQQHTTQPRAKTAPISKVVVVFTVLAVCVCLAASVFFLSKLGFSISLPTHTIASGVKVAGVDVGGLTKSQAIDAVFRSRRLRSFFRSHTRFCRALRLFNYFFKTLFKTTRVH